MNELGYFLVEQDFGEKPPLLFIFFLKKKQQKTGHAELYFAKSVRTSCCSCLI